MTTLRDDVVPEDLSAVVRDAAAALPPGGHHLSRVAPRRRAQRRRTATLSMALAGVAVLAAAVAVPLSLRPAPAPDRAGTPGGAIAQRMFVIGLGDGLAQGIRKPRHPDGEFAVRVPTGLVEITDAGPVAVFDNPDLRLMGDDVAGLPDGGVVMSGAWDRSNGATKRDGTAVMDMRSVLVVVGKDGKTRSKRDLGAANGTIRMVGIDGDTVYLLRGDRLVRHELASGAERDVPAAAKLREDLRQGWEVKTAGAGRAILANSNRVGVKAVSLDDASAEPVNLPACDSLCVLTSLTRVSPDGRHAAYAYSAKDGTRLVVVDLTNGGTVAERDLPGEPRLAGPGMLGWADGDTLRIGLVVAPEKDGTYDLKDVLKVETINL